MAIVQSLAGLRVLVVEDEMIVSLLIEDFLADQMCIVVGPYSRVDAAIGPARTAAIDFALLDVNLAGIKIYPVAEALQSRRVPFLLLSGYGEKAIPDDHPEWRACSKPFNLDVLATMMIEELSQGTQPATSTSA